MPNIFAGQVNASAPTNVLVGTSSGTAVAANNDRVGLVIVNISDSTIYIGLGGNAAVLKSGIALTTGGDWSMDDYTFNNEVVTAIAHTANSVISFQEFIR